MDNALRALTQGMSNVRIMDVTDRRHLQRAPDGFGPKAAKLTGHHAPSTAKFDELAQIHPNDLQQDHRHSGRVVVVKIVKIEYKHGALLSCVDAAAEDVEVMVWSLLLRPLGLKFETGMALSVREPYFGQCPSGEMAVCVHHPSDCQTMIDASHPEENSSISKTWSSDSDGRGSATMPISIMPRLCGIEVRCSPLGGRGMFATQAMKSGDLLLCEKPLALYTGQDASPYGAGIDGILSSKSTNARKLALIQQLVDKVAPNEILRKKLVRLHSGNPFDPGLVTTASDVFNTYTALSIIQHNAHIIFPGNTSDHHDFINKPTSDRRMTPADQRPGIWLEASMLNHSCLPNASWSWIGDMFVVRANREIQEGEEVTIAYVPSSYPIEKRKRILEEANEFQCRCALCVADSAAVRPDAAQHAIDKVQRLQRLTAKEATFLVREALALYPLDTYRGLPCPRLAEPLFKLGQLFMKDPKDKDMETKARDCFTACLHFGLGYNLICHQAWTGEYYELLTLEHSQPRPVGCLALMALAELAFPHVGSDTRACAALKACAKKIYGICYGEDRSFAKQHQYLRCKDVEAKTDDARSTSASGKRWEEIKEEARREKMVKRAWPRWLIENTE